MISSSIAAACVAALIPSTLAQFVSPPTDLIPAAGYAGYNVRYKQVPSGICETVPGVKSYSGYVDVQPNQHLFFYFIEARNVNPSTAPLTIWLNGGPGDTSMIGLFSENGPCYIDPNGNVQFNPYSWNNVSNMIYIDQPTQVGFSYSVPVNGYIDPNSGFTVTLPSPNCPDYAQGSCGTFSNGNASETANSTVNAAPNVWRALQGFMGAFPQYSRNGVHLSTESYGGHYGPVFSEYFETQNAALPPGAVPIALKSLSVGNGWYDPVVQYPSYYNFTVTPGNTYDFSPFNSSVAAELYNGYYGSGNCVAKLLDCNARGDNDVCSDADNFCYALESVYDEVTGRDEYDLRELSPDPFPYQTFVAYLNQAYVQKAIGAYTNLTYSVTNLGTGTVAAAFGSTGDDARRFDIISAIQGLLAKGVAVLQYAGDADYNCNWLGGQMVAAEVNAPGFTSAGFQNISTSDGIVNGVVKQAGGFSFARVYYAGHSVPFYQPLLALTMFARLLNNSDIATGKKVAVPGYLSVGPQQSTFREGGATIQYQVTDPSCTYNTVTHVPNCPGVSGTNTTGSKMLRKRDALFGRGMREWSA